MPCIARWSRWRSAARPRAGSRRSSCCPTRGDGLRGRLTGFVDTGEAAVDAFREAIFGGARPVWPPADLDQLQGRLQVLAPGGASVFDSSAPGATPPPALLPGERLEIRHIGAPGTQPLVIEGKDEAAGQPSPWITRLVRRLPVQAGAQRAQAREVLATPAGRYEINLTGDARGIERGLAVVATRMSWYVGAMLTAIVLAWLAIEVGLIRRITVLTKRAAAVSHNVQRAERGGERIRQLDVSDLRGPDELGILAGGLSDLLQRVKDDVQREQLRAQQERDMLQAVGHEILSPLLSLMVLHPGEDDPARRYVQRMQHAVRVLYGQASPRGEPVPVRADEFSLEDVLTHVLRNADRYREPGSATEIALRVQDGQAEVRIHNGGPAIDTARLVTIFDYGVNNAAPGDGGTQRGQGLFVARSYLARMGGSIRAANEDGGVAMRITLPLA